MVGRLFGHRCGDVWTARVDVQDLGLGIDQEIHVLHGNRAEQGLIAALRALIEQDFRGTFAEVTWHVASQGEVAAGQLPPYVSQVVFFAAQELIRNAARHGRGPGDRPLRLQVVVEAGEGIRLAVEDDGVGYHPGTKPSPGEVSSGGRGLRFHSTMLAAVGAGLEVAALPAGGTRGQIIIPSAAIQDLAP